MNKYTSFMHIFFVTLLTVTLASKAHGASTLERVEDVLKNGDLIFLNLDCGELCDAIEDVTLRQFETKEPHLSHVGMAFYDRPSKKWVVYEAWDGVQKTPLPKFLKHVEDNAGSIFVKRAPLKRREIKRIQKWMDKKVGMPYDPDFLLNNEKYYCSELITDAFQAVQKQPLFGYLPMYYGDLHDKKDTSARIWIQYFKKKGSKIPQNQPGISPLGLYLNAALQPVKF